MGSMVIDTESQLKCIPVDESDDLETDDEWDGIDESKKVKLSKLGKKNGNDFLAQFFDQLPSKKTDKDIPLKKPLSFDYLFETSSTEFTKNLKTNEIDINMELFEYDGGLTTPPFSEGDNNRVCQDYCGRIVKLRSNSSMQVV